MALITIDGVLYHTSIFDNLLYERSKPWGRVLERYFMKDVMVDLETLGTTPGATILSIGAVAFNAASGEMCDEGLHVIISRDSCKHFGLHEEDGTLEWWGRQSKEARETLLAATAGHPPAVGLQEALEELNEYVRGRPGVRVWGNGANFDNPLLAVASTRAGIKPAYQFFNERCYRTIKNLAPHVKLQREGTYHNALDDARSQTKHLLDIVRSTTLTLA